MKVAWLLHLEHPAALPMARDPQQRYAPKSGELFRHVTSRQRTSSIAKKLTLNGVMHVNGDHKVSSLTIENAVH